MNSNRKEIKNKDYQGIYFYVYAVVISLAVIVTVLTT